MNTGFFPKYVDEVKILFRFDLEEPNLVLSRKPKDIVVNPYIKKIFFNQNNDKQRRIATIASEGNNATSLNTHVSVYKIKHVSERLQIELLFLIYCYVRFCLRSDLNIIYYI